MGAVLYFKFFSFFILFLFSAMKNVAYMAGALLFCLVALISDTKATCDSNWKARNHKPENPKTCKIYAQKAWCANLSYGDGWNPKWGKFKNYTDHLGRTALVCPECGCKATCDSNWEARNHKPENPKTCKIYAQKAYCANLSYGDGWNLRWGKFENYADHLGRTALVCPECGCKGDIAESNPCDSNPCQNSGRCRNNGGRFECDCGDNFYGETCQYDYRAAGVRFWSSDRKPFGPAVSRGRLQVFFNDEWGSVCADISNSKSVGAVACRAFGGFVVKTGDDVDTDEELVSVKDVSVAKIGCADKAKTIFNCRKWKGNGKWCKKPMMIQCKLKKDINGNQFVLPKEPYGKP